MRTTSFQRKWTQIRLKIPEGNNIPQEKGGTYVMTGLNPFAGTTETF